MAADASIVSDLSRSARNAARYWSALRAKGLERLRAVSAGRAPEKSYVWPRAIYSKDVSDRLSGASLEPLFEIERERFSGMPMRDPAAFLSRLGDEPPLSFSYVDSSAVEAGPNAKLTAALGAISRLWPDALAELRALVLGAAWIKSDGDRVRTLSDPKRFGVIHLCAEHFSGASAYELATALIHEAAHHALFVETALDPLIPDDYRAPTYSPLRQETRPAIGVLHASFAMARMGQWGRLLLEKTPGKSAGLAEGRRVREKHIGRLRESLEGLKAVRLSPRGDRMLKDISSLTDALESIHA